MNELEYLQSEEALKTSSKKDLYNMLYKRIENYYINYKSDSFKLLNDQNTKNFIINDILEKANYSIDNEIYLKQQYYKINKAFYLEYKNYINKESEPIEEKKQLNWSYFWETILKLLLFPLFVILGCTFTYDKQVRRNRRG